MRVECPPMAVRIRGRLLVMIVAVLTLAVACGGAATTEPTPTEQQSTTDSPLITPSQVAPSTSPPALRPASTQLPASSQATQAPPTQAPTPSVESPKVILEKAFSSLSFSRLTNLVQAGDRLFVTEQVGRVMSFPSTLEPAESAIFLDIRSRVSTAGNEEGLLGLVFDPKFEANGHFYVYYSAAGPRRSVVSRFTQRDGVAVPESELVVLEVPQPFSNHNGGQLAFGPDSMLYISLGDGGAGGDPQGNGQNRSALLGSILRIDVSGLTPDQGYRVPPDNPFAGSTDARGEIWAYGLRNPWRFTFDRENGDLWAGDVGQNSFEEVDLVVKGGNYGWNTLEGGHCFSPRTGCDPSGTLLPVIEYSANKGCSVIGGHVYRGTEIPRLNGTYIYGDYCSGEVHGFRIEIGEATGHSRLIDSGLNITSFGEDSQGEIYSLTRRGGIYRLKADR